MAVGDVWKGIEEVVASGSVDIKPLAGIEAVVHNIYFGGECTISITNGVITVDFYNASEGGVMAWFEFHLTENHYLNVVNSGAVTIGIGWDGVRTK